ncbi:MAG TPA: BON domain-containing protein [Candidatus Acidoferrales bacterium]|nr:BON domain-containing protein [Candidatus Acidoferrales bacterium]
MRVYSPSSPRGFILFLAALLSVAFGANASSLGAFWSQASHEDRGTEESSIVREVHHQLVMLPFYTLFDNLEYKVEGSKVTLMGQVVRPNLKDDAASAVKRVRGVETVDNQIKVLPLSPMDNQIRRAEYRAIYSRPNLQMYAMQSVPPIHIVVDHGHVTLEGIVARQADKDAAGIAANGVPNVFSVTNNLRVENSGSK